MWGSYKLHHPRALARCSDAVLELVVVLFLKAESAGAWFEAIAVMMVILIPKGDGGRRPISLCPTLVRVWMRVRLDVAQEWAKANDRSFLYAGPCKGADVAAWNQCLLAEGSRAMSLPYLASLQDLVQAFDTVPFDHLAQCGGRLGYSLFLLRLSIASYLLARVLDVKGCFSVLVWATRGLGARAVVATIKLRLLLLEAGDRVVAAC